jgi:hypothetical protein
MAAKSEPPRCIEVRVNFGGDGKVAIKEYGKISSGYHASITRAYTIPEEWGDKEIETFEQDLIMTLRDELEPILQAEFDERYEQRDWT